MSIETFLPIFFLVVTMIISVSVAQAMKAEKKKKEEQRRQGGINPQSGESDPFEETRGSQNTGARVSAPAKSVEPQKRFVEGTDLVETKPRVHTSARVVAVTKSHHDEHCDVSHYDGDTYIVEKVPVSGSIGGRSEEGCGEHYNLRFVKVETEESESGKILVEADEVRKAIVLGEVLNDPAFRKY